MRAGHRFTDFRKPGVAVLTGVGVKRVEESSFLVVMNGSPDSPPAYGVRDFLAARAHEVTVINHPLNREDPPEHGVALWRRGELVEERTLRRPSRPPLTYAIDALTPFVRPRVDGWIGFNNLSAVHGIARRRLGLVGRVAYWAVDFVPERFGAGSPLTRLYDRADRFAATHSDLRVELTTVARDARAERLGLGNDASPTHIAPVGVWLDRIERTPADAWRTRNVVFIGHLVPRQGVATLLEAIALLPDVNLTIAGRGPEEDRLRRLSAELGIPDRVRFVGFISDHREVERLAASAAVAAAPYATDMQSFTKYADPSKLRTYTGAGLPIVTTDVPPNAHELAREAGASVVAYEPRAIADAIAAILASPEKWQRRRAAALAYAEGFDWSRIVPEALNALGFRA